jgi:hypothetical protein
VARCLFKIGKKEEGFARIMDMLGKVISPAAMSRLYEGLAELYNEDQDLELRAFALEKALELKPNDTAAHFKTAYSYSFKNLERLALLHYKILS